ncbi:hypothetical protein KIL84_018099 [Mauremys mutica]|uniref:Uncharacterized protein n=1 Tax=Mauremys mutica TaxID=74926 RepID=A0A9D3XUB1_9SAUR|nr:hypothetical protein KIL84_018099 [Mauremys mutica]
MAVDKVQQSGQWCESYVQQRKLQAIEAHLWFLGDKALWDYLYEFDRILRGQAHSGKFTAQEGALCAVFTAQLGVCVCRGRSIFTICSLYKYIYITICMHKKVKLPSVCKGYFH